MLKKLKQHYHWVIAFLAFLEMIIYGGWLNSASVFIIPISEGLGVSRGSFSMATIPYTLVCFTGTMLSGWLFRKFGYKRCVMVSLLVVIGSFVVTASANSLAMYTFSKILFGLGYGCSFTAGAVFLIKNWFFKHQGLVVGAVSMASGLGGSLMTMVLTELIETTGWRVANLVAAGITAVIWVLYLLIKDRPEEMGLRPFGFGEIPGKKKAVRPGTHDWPGYSSKELLRHPSFYLMCLCTLVSCVCIYITSGVLVPHFRAQGFDPQAAAAMQSFLMLTLAAAKLIFGGLSDKLGAKTMTVLSMACAVAGQFLLCATDNLALCYVAVVLFSIGMCMTALMAPLLSAPLFGYRGCLSANSILLALCSLASLFSGPISNTCFDLTGSYVPAFRIAAVVNTVVLALYLVLFILASWERKRFFEAHPKETAV